METVEIMVRLPKDLYLDVKNGHASNIQRERVIEHVKNGIPLPEGHGKIVDLGNIDKDRIEQNNPVMTINIYGTAIEAVPLDYLYNLPDLTKKEVENGTDR